MLLILFEYDPTENQLFATSKWENNIYPSPKVENHIKIRKRSTFLRACKDDMEWVFLLLVKDYME